MLPRRFSQVSCQLLSPGFTTSLSSLALLVPGRKSVVAHGYMPSCRREHAFLQTYSSQHKHYAQSLHSLVFETQKSHLFQFKNLKFGFVYLCSQETSRGKFISISNYEATIHISIRICILSTIHCMVLKGKKDYIPLLKVFLCFSLCFSSSKILIQLIKYERQGFLSAFY